MAIETNNSGLANWIRDIMYNDTVVNRNWDKGYKKHLENIVGTNEGAVTTLRNTYDKLIDEASKNPLSFKRDVNLGTGADGKPINLSGAGVTANLALDKIKAHPWKTAGLGVGVGTNLAGLFDNPNIAGQLVGAGAGTAVPFLLNKFAGTNIGGYGKLMSGLIGGGVGSLFDKLMANKAEQQQYQGQY